MDKKKLLFWMMVTLIVILSIFIFKIHSLGKGFALECTTLFNVNATCPCTAKEVVNQLGGLMPNITNYNFSIP